MDRNSHSQVFNDYRPNQTLFDSHYTRVSSQQDNQDSWFTEQRAYSRSVLAGWGLPLGELPYSHDNEQTLRCLVELIALRQKDLQFRSKAKQDNAAINFEKEKYRSFMEQAQRNLDDCMRKLGRTENEASDLKNRNRKTEVQGKKEREDDRRMIAMLRTKNEQILHEIKKKEQEVNRIKEQMKKSVGEKSLNQAKNSFDLFEVLSPHKRDPQKQEESRYIFLLERNEREMGQLVKENGLLREKIFELREQLLDFSEWTDRELFGENNQDQFKRKTQFPLNHNLLFKKESLTQEFAALLETAKDGVLQLRNLYRESAVSSQRKTVRSSQILPPRGEMEELNFKKKVNKPDAIRTDRSRPERKSKGKQTPTNKKAELFTDNYSSPRSKKVPVPKFEGPKQNSTLKQLNKGFEMSEVKSHKGSLSLSELELPFQNELMSDVVENQDSSIVSHIEVDNLGKNRFDKWDILYQDDQ